MVTAAAAWLKSEGPEQPRDADVVAEVRQAHEHRADQQHDAAVQDLGVRGVLRAQRATTVAPAPAARRLDHDRFGSSRSCRQTGALPLIVLVAIGSTQAPAAP